MNIRNIAIIAHVDHGKSTLVNSLLQHSGTFRANEEIKSVDSDTLEQERGITIIAKPTSVIYKDYKINILDTPGHADFGGEVERILNMVDGVILVVDAYEGTMPQTRFVLKKALESGAVPIVVVNKIDKDVARPLEVVDEVMDLFIELGATIEQLEFPVIYASAISGTTSFSHEVEKQENTMEPILETIIKEIPEPKVIIDGGFQFQPALLDYNEYTGRIGVGLVKRGHVKQGEQVSCIRLDGKIEKFRIQKIFGFDGLSRIEVKEASAGDIIAISGLADIYVGETITTVGQEEALEKLHIDEPTMKMTFGVNSSPFAGQDGKLLTARQIEERLVKETERDVSLKVEKLDSESWEVSGRGELHLSILIENMRRQGYELQVAKPEVILKEVNGEIQEPFEDVQIDINEESVGSVIESLSRRGGKVENITSNENGSKLTYTIPSRGLIGFGTEFMTITKGYGIINHTFKEYQKKISKEVGTRSNGVLVSMENGKATAYSLGALEDRGIMFVEPGAEIYEGMIVGENNHSNDLAVNVVKGKQLTNMRTAGKDSTVVLKRPKTFSLETALDYIDNEELVEVTPKTFRLRKKILNTAQRKKEDKKQIN